jgi:hypothetical protein
VSLSGYRFHNDQKASLIRTRRRLKQIETILAAPYWAKIQENSADHVSESATQFYPCSR